MNQQFESVNKRLESLVFTIYNKEQVDDFLLECSMDISDTYYSDIDGRWKIPDTLMSHEYFPETRTFTVIMYFKESDGSINKATFTIK